MGLSPDSLIYSNLSQTSILNIEREIMGENTNRVTIREGKYNLPDEKFGK